MNITHNILIVIMLLTASITFAQEKIIGQYHTRTIIDTMDLSKVFYKETGVKVEKRDFMKLVETNPNLQLERIIGLDGEVEKYLVVLSEPKKSIKNNRTTPVLQGELFPNFIAKTIENDRVELDKLRGKLVILRFELEANTFRFKKDEIQQIDDLINKVKHKDEQVEAIVFFASNKSEVKQGFDIVDSNFKVIPNSSNFLDKFSITRYPTTIVLDRNGTLIDYYKDIDDLDLEKLISE